MDLLEEVKSEKRITYLKALADKVNKHYKIHVPYSKYKLADIEVLRKELLKAIKVPSPKEPPRGKSPTRKLPAWLLAGKKPPVKKQRSHVKRLPPPKKPSPKKPSPRTSQDLLFYKSIIDAPLPPRMSKTEVRDKIGIYESDEVDSHLQARIKAYFLEQDDDADVCVIDLNDKVESANAVWTSYATRLAYTRGFGAKLHKEVIIEGPGDTRFRVIVTAISYESYVTATVIPDVVQCVERMHKAGIVHGKLGQNLSFYCDRNGIWHVRDFSKCWLYKREVPEYMKIYDYAMLLFRLDKMVARTLRQYLAKSIFSPKQMAVLNDLKDCDIERIKLEYAKLPPDEQRPLVPRSFIDGALSPLLLMLYIVDRIPPGMLAQLRPEGALRRFEQLALGKPERAILSHRLKNFTHRN